MKKRNGMCPFCYLRTIISPLDREQKKPVLYNIEPYANGLAQTPPMGWSSWNTFQEKINQDVVIETAKLMKEKGLADAGYIYVNIDDCWEAKERTLQGELQADFRTFSMGIDGLVKEINSLGMKLGIYSSNGKMTCQDFPATLGYEYTDAYTFAKWGVEYWKLDFCHHVDFTPYAPLLAGISVAKKGEAPDKIYTAEEGKRSGFAHIFKSSFAFKKDKSKNCTMKNHISGLDAHKGAVEYEISVPEDGEYVLTLYTHEVYRYKKLLAAQINDGKLHLFHIPENIRWNEYYTQKMVTLKKGTNKIRLFNPIKNPATSDMLQYQHVGDCVKKATARYAQETGQPERKIMFSLCEWGNGHPYLWGASASNLWRTTGDISADWKSITKLYDYNVELYKYADKGFWNDPDMLEVGVGKLTYNENEAHFALWCMMNSPLILGNDIRKMSDEILSLVTNKALIAINQDGLGKQAKRIVKGNVDVLVKPLENGETAICFFNKTSDARDFSITEADLKGEAYINYKSSEKALDLLTGQKVATADILKGNIPARSVKVYRI